MPTKRKKRDAKATSAALKSAGRELFATLGYDGVRTQLIADRAGANKAMINYYFGGKQGLYATVIREDIDRALQGLEPVQTSEGSPSERLDLFIETMASFIAENPFFPLIMVREQMNGARHLRKHERERFLGFFRLTQTIVEEGIETGAFRNVDPHATHISLIGSLVYFMMTEPARTAYADAKPGAITMPPWSDYVEHVRELFRRGLADAED